MTEKRGKRCCSCKNVFGTLIILIAVGLGILSRLEPFLPATCSLAGHKCPAVTVNGFTAPGFQSVRELFEANLKSGKDFGSTFTAYVDGKRVVDLWGGYKDPNYQDPYTADTLVMVYSSSKAVSSFVVAMLVDRGHIKFEDKIATHWPEFAQGNKENVTVRDLLQHSAGVSYLTTIGAVPTSLAADLDKFAEVLAREPHNNNGTRETAYHAVTYGYYINELVRRTDPKRRSIGQFIREEINEPLGVEVYIGLPEHLLPRVATLADTPLYVFMVRSLWQVFVPDVIYNWMRPFLKGTVFEFDGRDTVKQIAFADAQHAAKSFVNNVEGYETPNMSYYGVEIASCNGLSNARSLGKIAALIANGGEIDGVRLLSKETIDAAHANLDTQFDLTLQMNFTRTAAGWAYFPELDMLGWAGFGGSLIQWNRERNVAIGYAMNGMAFETLGEGRGAGLTRAVHRCIEQMKQKN